MKRAWLVVVAAAALGGCASSAKIRAGAEAHLYEAHRLEAKGDYRRADIERSKASDQFAKANARAYRESQAGVYPYY